MANDRDNHDDNETSGHPAHQGTGPKVGDAIKKLVTAGISAAFMTEESIRGFVSELKLPKETLNLLVQGATKSKEDLMNRVSREVIGIVSKIDFVKEASRFVEEHKFRITAEIDVVRKDAPPASPSQAHSNGGSGSGADTAAHVAADIKAETKPGGTTDSENV